MANAKASAQRLGRLRDWMAAEGVDAFLVRGTSDIMWATAFDGVFDDEQAHALAVTCDDAVLHTDSRYAEACEREAQGCPVRVDAAVERHADWAAHVLSGAGAVAFDDLMSVREHRALRDALGAERLRPTADVILELRGCKDAFEVERLRAAQAITDAGFAHIVGFIRPGLTERAVQLELDRFMMDAGADGLAFPTIVAAGAHASSPHAQPGETRIQPGDAVVMDFGARKDGYCSDMTRTVFVAPVPPETAAAYEVLRRANEECAAMVAAGAVAADIHAHAEQVLAEGGFAGKMGHSLGHGVGIDIHELPVLSPRNGEPLPAGAAVTVEPGIYLPGAFGMRLEDCGLVTAAGYERFGSSTHDMVVIG